MPDEPRKREEGHHDFAPIIASHSSRVRPDLAQDQKTSLLSFGYKPRSKFTFLSKRHPHHADYVPRRAEMVECSVTERSLDIPRIGNIVQVHLQT